jgi:hypothetical protein
LHQSGSNQSVHGMNKKEKIADLQHDSLKEQPFIVPEGYFESFSDRLKERLRKESIPEEETAVPVRHLFTSRRFRLAMAAAVVGLAFVSYALIRYAGNNTGSSGTYPDIALIEQMQIIDDDTYLMELMSDETESLDEQEAFANQAIDYLAVNDVEMVLFFE